MTARALSACLAGPRGAWGKKCNDQTYRTALDTDGRDSCWGVHCLAASRGFRLIRVRSGFRHHYLIILFEPKRAICEVYGPAGRAAAEREMLSIDVLTIGWRKVFR